MPRECSRRDFLNRMFAASACSALIASARGFGDTAGMPTPTTQPKPPPYKISLAQWSLHRTLEAGKLDPMHFAQTAKNDYGIEAIEYVNTFYKNKATDQAYLREMKKRADDLGVRSLIIMCDGEGALGDADAAKRHAAIQNHHKWIDAAKILGCHSIRVNAASSGTPEEQHKLVVDGLSRLTEYGISTDINIIVENHGGLSSNGAWLAAVIFEVNSARCGTLPDFGNFHLGKNAKGNDEWYDRYQGVRELMPWAKAVSAKSNDFDAKGNETQTDFRKMLRIVLDCGYRGHIGIEYEGERLSEPEGIRATKTLLERLLEEFSR
jgi:L-ribulose-5-phosphate 3-epimerase